MDEIKFKEQRWQEVQERIPILKGVDISYAPTVYRLFEIDDASGIIEGFLSLLSISKEGLTYWLDKIQNDNDCYRLLFDMAVQSDRVNLNIARGIIKDRKDVFDEEIDEEAYKAAMATLNKAMSIEAV